jgi:hypothetical protein
MHVKIFCASALQSLFDISIARDCDGGQEFTNSSYSGGQEFRRSELKSHSSQLFTGDFGCLICIGNYTVREVLMKNRTRVWRNIYNTASA